MLPSMLAFALLQLVLCQDTVESCLLDGTCSDDASVLQVAAREPAADDADDDDPPTCRWIMGDAGKSCRYACKKELKFLVCDPSQQKALTKTAMAALVPTISPHNCGEFVLFSGANYAPFWATTNNRCYAAFGGADSKCGREKAGMKRVCCCVARGSVDNDPHVHTLRGDRYTLLRSGNFLAWSYTKAPVDWQLYAAYSGPSSRFTTQSLLLMEKQSGQTMEFTAETCAWHMKTETGWQPVQQSNFSKGAASLEVQEVHTVTEDPLNLESVIFMKMSSDHGGGKIARLLTHCSPQKHVNFLLKMFDTKHLDHVGGELGSLPNATTGHVSFLSAKATSMVMKEDAEFEVLGTWASLGGSDATAKFVESRQQAGTSLLSAGCTEAEEQEAEKICAKHLKKDGDHAGIFEECVFDVCHGGGEADALSAAALFSADSDI